MDNNYYGEYKVWYNNGELFVSGNHILGKRIGEWKWFNRNGKKDSTKVYNDGQLYGLSTIYFDGKQVYKLMYYINDKLHGEMKTFYNDGKIQSLLTFKYGKRSGAFRYWDENGATEEEGAYLNDKLHGLVTRWYNEQQISSITMFADGSLQGLMRVFSPSGSTMKEGYYYNGNPVIIFEYYENGRFKRIQVYREDEIIDERLWTESGVNITNHTLGLRTKSNVHTNGNPKYECTFMNNNKHGIEWYWGEYFDLQSLNVYDQGTLVLSRTWTSIGQPNIDILFPGDNKEVIIGPYSSVDLN
jgi:antitoxin component YwqK of YwqJK toxin-antitoxin module